MTESPREQHDLPPEEDVDPADAADRLNQDPDETPNAPNRAPDSPPDPSSSPHERGQDRDRDKTVEPPGVRDDPTPTSPPH